MTSMTRWNPFKTLSRIDPFSDFDDFLRSAAMRPVCNGTEIAPDIRIDLTEDDGACSVKADIPGVKKDDIDTPVNGVRIGSRHWPDSPRTGRRARAARS